MGVALRDLIDLAWNIPMDNILSLQADRPRPHRDLGVPRGGARILFFTGVRYCREDVDPSPRGEVGPIPAHLAATAESGLRLDAAAH